MLDGVVNDAVEARALSLNPSHIDIYSGTPHCNENLIIYVFPEMELRGLNPNFHIHACACELFLYIPRIGLHIVLQQNRQTNRGNK
jgi:hypothetical protein